MTVASVWRFNGQQDPFGDLYLGGYEKFTYGHLTHNELANELCKDHGFLGIAYTTAAKERIRWLSRRLHKVITTKQEMSVVELERSKLLFGDYTDDELANYCFLIGKKEKDYNQVMKAAKQRMLWLADLIDYK